MTLVKLPPFVMRDGTTVSVSAASGVDDFEVEIREDGTGLCIAIRRHTDPEFAAITVDPRMVARLNRLNPLQ